MKRIPLLLAGICSFGALLFAPGCAPPRPSEPVKIGALTNFTKEGIDIRFLTNGFFLVRGKDRIYALPAFCTHQTDARLSGRAGGERLIALCKRQGRTACS